MVAAHAVNAAAGRCGGGAQVQPRQRGRIGARGQDRPREELPKCVASSPDVSIDLVRIRLLERGWWTHVPSQDQGPKAGRKALHLSLNALGHVLCRPEGHVAIGPAGVAADGRSARIEQTRLGQEHERPLGATAGVHVGLAARDLLQRAAEVDGARSPARGGLPRDRTFEGPVELEGGRPMTEPPEPSTVTRGKSVTGESEKLSWRHVAENGADALDI